MTDQSKTRKGNTGAYAVVTPSQVFVYNTEVKALRKAVEIGGAVKFAEWGEGVYETPNSSTMVTSSPEPESTETDDADESEF